MNIVIWALATGGITGAVWVAIVLIQRQRRIDRGRRGLDDAELEARLDFAERLLAQKRWVPLDQK